MMILVAAGYNFSETQPNDARVHGEWSMEFAHTSKNALGAVSSTRKPLLIGRK